MITLWDYGLVIGIAFVAFIVVIGGGIEMYEAIRRNWNNVREWRSFTFFLLALLFAILIRGIVS